MPFEIIKNDLASMAVDAIVHAETQQPLSFFNFNPNLVKGKGRELAKSREEVGAVPIGEAKIIPNNKLDTKYIIHTSGPIWHGGLYHETKLLRACYEKTFQLALEHGCKSIALPIIASDNLGFPKKMTQQIAFEYIQEFLKSHDMMIYVVVPSITSILMNAKEFSMLRVQINKTCKEDGASEEVSDVPCTASDEAIKNFIAGLEKWMNQKNLAHSELSHKANMSPTLLAKILSGSQKLSKKNAIALGIALELTLDEMREFIEKLGYTLKSGDKFDTIIKHYVSNGNYDVVEINQMLFKFEQNLLG